MFYGEVMFVSIFCRALKNLIKVFHKLWIGLVNINKEDDKNHKNNWYWIDGKKAINEETNWNKGEPNSPGKENCAEVVNNAFQFNDQECTDKLTALCEIDCSGLH